MDDSRDEIIRGINVYDTILSINNDNLQKDSNYKINNDKDEVDESNVPVWIRYLPKQQYIKMDPKNKLPMDDFISIDSNVSNIYQAAIHNVKDTSYSNNSNTSINNINVSSISHGSRRKYVRISRSCNPFGPYSSHAINVENPIKLNKKRYVDSSNDRNEINHNTMNSRIENADVNLDSIDNSNDSFQYDRDGDNNGRNKKKKKYTNTNVLEASELFSIVRL